MFEYSKSIMKIYGFSKIIYLDELKFECEYKNKELIVNGKGLRAINLADKSIEISGLLEGVQIKYKGGLDD